MINLKAMNKKRKIVIILMLLSVLACILYLPWKAEKHTAYGNTLTRPLGYALIGYKPAIYVESDFDITNSTSFSDIKEKQELQNKSITIHPNWVKIGKE